MTAISTLETWCAGIADLQTKVANPNIRQLHHFDKQWRFWPNAKKYTPIIQISADTTRAFESEIRDKVSKWTQLGACLRSYDSVKIPCEARVGILENLLIDLEPSPVKKFFTEAVESVKSHLNTDSQFYGYWYDHFYTLFPQIVTLASTSLRTKNIKDLENLKTALKTEQVQTEIARGMLHQAHAYHRERYITLSPFSESLNFAEERLKDPKIPYVTLVDLLNPSIQLKVNKNDFDMGLLLDLWIAYCQILIGYRYEDCAGSWLQGKRVFLDRWISSLAMINPALAEGQEAVGQFQMGNVPYKDAT